MAPKVVRYRWDVYGSQKHPTPWRDTLTMSGEAFGFTRACRALLMPQERIRFELENGQQCVVRLKRG